MYISGCILAVGVLCYFVVPSFHTAINEAWQVLTSGDQDAIERWVEGFGWFGPVAIIVAMIAQMFLIVVPSVVLMVASVLAYGPVWGSIIILIAIFSASSIGYFIGAYVGEQFIDSLIGKKNEKKVARFIQHYGFWAIVITRVNPFLSNDAISFVAGTLKMGYWRFIAATMLGILPLTIFIAVLGKATTSMKQGLLWGSAISALIFLAYIIWDKKRKK